jgi:translation initiation factor 3 subunit A
LQGRLAKEGLHQYKNITGSTSLNSLEIVVNHYLKSAEDRVASARSELDKVVLDFDDLEASETPER